jgi:Ser/Thr protein kinase RdoA (MazF antagonist)
LEEGAAVLQARHALDAFVPAEAYVLRRHFITPEGLPKTVWSHCETGALVLLGSLPLHWPEPARVEALLPWLNAWEASVVPETDGIVLRRYHRARSDAHTVASPSHRHFLTTYAPVVRPSVPADGRALARALASFHRLGQRQLALRSAPFARESLRELLHHWLLPALEAARQQVPADLRRALDGACADLHRLTPRRLEALDALPPFLIHGDWQAKNLLLRKDPDAKGAVHVLDSESCRLFPRLWDVYFLFSWDDACTGLQRPNLARERWRDYVEGAGGLSAMERELLPDLLRIKALSNAAWSSEGQPPWRQRRQVRRVVLRNSLRMAEALKTLDSSWFSSAPTRKA